MNSRRLFIKNFALGASGVGIYSTFSACNSSETESGNNQSELLKNTSGKLPRATPESQGLSSTQVLKFLDALEATGQECHSLMILKNGYVLVEAYWDPYSSDHKQQLYSLSKSFTSTAIGLAHHEGLLSIDDPVISFFPDQIPDEVSDNLATMKIRHLLSMSVGHATDSILTLEKTVGQPWSKTFLDLPVEYEPGTRFLYNSGASFMLCAILQKVTGMTAHDFLKPRLFEPLGIEGSTWTTNPDGINMGASHLRLKAEDLAKFGQLYLQKGKWDEKTIIPPEWIEMASSKQISNGNNDSSWAYGYGFQFWLNPVGGFRADGAFGQYSMIFPDVNSVIVLTGESFATADTMQAIWDHLHPYLGGEVSIPTVNQESQKLNERLSALQFSPPAYNSFSKLQENIHQKEIALKENVHGIKSLKFDFSEDYCTLFIYQENRTDQIQCGWNDWYIGDNYKPSADALFSTLRIDFDSTVAAAAGWKDDNTLVLTWRHIETTHTDTITCKFEDQLLELSFRNSINGKPEDEDKREKVLSNPINL